MDWHFNPTVFSQLNHLCLGNSSGRLLCNEAFNSTSSIIHLEAGTSIRDYICLPARLVNHHGYANTPWCLFQWCLKKVVLKKDMCTIVIVTPQWITQCWQKIMQLAQVTYPSFQIYFYQPTQVLPARNHAPIQLVAWHSFKRSLEDRGVLSEARELILLAWRDSTII